VVEQSQQEWKPSQIFGEDPSSAASEDHIISGVSFNNSGNLLAVGYQSGQVVVFRNVAGTFCCRVVLSESLLRLTDPFPPLPPRSLLLIIADTYKFCTQFESHTPEFDFMTSTEIEERISDMTWLPHTFRDGSSMILTTNDRTVKLFRLGEKKRRTRKPPRLAETENEANSGKTQKSESDGSDSDSSDDQQAPNIGATNKRVFKNAHTYNVNSLSVCADGAHFISVDDLRINLWNLEVKDTCFTVVDCKPDNIAELDEVITAAKFHPSLAHEFAYGCSNGNIHLADLRVSSTCDKPASTFKADPVSGPELDFFSEVIGSIGDVCFAQDGRYLFARDYLSVHLFDLRMDREPVMSYPVHDNLIPQLPELYENESMFDKFQLCSSKNGLRIVTGSYSNSFHVYDAATGSTMTRMVNNPRIKGQPKGPEYKMTRICHHPEKDVVAMSGGSYIYLYHKIEKPI
jgi:serine/threonine-protein phosphatase 2A regulatory subunit B